MKRPLETGLRSFLLKVVRATLKALRQRFCRIYPVFCPRGRSSGGGGGGSGPGHRAARARRRHRPRRGCLTCARPGAVPAALGAEMSLRRRLGSRKTKKQIYPPKATGSGFYGRQWLPHRCLPPEQSLPEETGPQGLRRARWAWQEPWARPPGELARDGKQHSGGRQPENRREGGSRRKRGEASEAGQRTRPGSGPGLAAGGDRSLKGTVSRPSWLAQLVAVTP